MGGCDRSRPGPGGWGFREKSVPVKGRTFLVFQPYVMSQPGNDIRVLESSDAGRSAPGASRVYLDFYGLREAPFSVTPDPEFLYFSGTHKNVVDKVLYGINNRMGFILLIGEVGTGKTTICRSVLDRLKDQYETVYVINPSISGRELIAGILDDLGIAYQQDASKKILIDRLNAFLLSQARRRSVIIIIDDAQTMPADALEDLRLLSNLETDKEKLIQLILVGQPELLTLLGRPEMRQISQRISIICRLEGLNREEIDGYIARRLFIAGDSGHIRFTHQAIGRIAAASKGIPRLINRICDYTLTSGYIDDAFVLGTRHVREALKELGDLEAGGRSVRDGGTGRRVRALKFVPVAVPVLFVAAVILFSSRYIPFHPDERKGEYGRSPDRAFDSADIVHFHPVTDPVTPMPEISAKPAVNRIRAQDRHLPFILLLGSYRTLANTLNGASSLNRRGIEAHWNRVDLGREGCWYRLFTGPFRSKTDARECKKNNGLTGSIIVFAPWSVQVGRADFSENLEEIQKRLRENRYDFYHEKTRDDRCRILVGAFTTREGAEELAVEMGLLDLDVNVVER